MIISVTLCTTVRSVMSSRATWPFESARICISTECTFYSLILLLLLFPFPFIYRNTLQQISSTRMSPSWILLQQMMEMVVTAGTERHANLMLQLKYHHQHTNAQFFQAECPACHPTVSKHSRGIKHK